MILVDIYVPSVDQTFDFELDENADIRSVLIEVTGMLARKTGSEKAGDAAAFILYNADKGQPMADDRTLHESGIRDGDRLILV